MSYTIPDQKLWFSLDISPRELESLRDSWSKTLKNIVNIYQNDEKQKIVDFLEEKEIDTNDDKTLKRVCLKTKGICLYALWKFQINKIDILKDFFSLLDIELINKQKALLSLIQLYEIDKKKLLDAYHYYLFRKTPHLETLRPEPAVTEQLVNKFKTIERTIIRRANKKLQNNNRLAYYCKINKAHYFYFEKFKQEKVIVGYAERKNIRTKESFFIRFDVKGNLIDINSKNKKVSDIFESILFDLKLKLFLTTPKPINENVSNFITKITDFDNNNVKLVEIKYRQLEKGINAQTILKQLKNQPDLKSIIMLLKQEGLIDSKNYRNLQSFTMEFAGFRKKINLRTINESIIFEIKPDGLAKSKFEGICKSFTDTFKIQPNVEYYNIDLSAEEKKNILQNLIGKFVSSLSKEEILVYEQFKESSILHKVIDIKLECSQDKFHNIRNNDAVCPICESKIISLLPRERIIVDNDRLLLYLKKRFESILGSNSAKIIVPRNKQINHYLKIKTLISDIVIYPYDSSIKKQLTLWERDFIPVIQVIIGKDIPEYQNLRLTSSLYLYDLLFDNDIDLEKKFKTATLNKYNQIIKEKIKSSKAILLEINKGKEVLDITDFHNKGDAFEDVTYPFLHDMFFEIYRWGRNKRFKCVPDGVLGFKMSNRKTEAFTMIYDFKYSDSSSDMDKRQAKDYIDRASKSPSIKKFSKELSVFMIIGHNVTNTKFINYSNNNYTLKKWKNGKCVLIRCEELIKLYDSFENLVQKDDTYKLAFNLAFANLIREHAERTIIFNITMVESIIKKTEEIKGNFNVQDFYEYMKSNITE